MTATHPIPAHTVAPLGAFEIFPVSAHYTAYVQEWVTNGGRSLEVILRTRQGNPVASHEFDTCLAQGRFVAPLARTLLGGPVGLDLSKAGARRLAKDLQRHFGG